METLQLGSLLLWILLLPQFIFILIFYLNRFVYPINARQPLVAVLTNIIAIGYATLLWVTVTWDVPCQVNKWIQFWLLNTSQFCLNYRMTQLLFSYEITRNITELKDHKNIADWKANWFTRHRDLVQNKFTFKVILVRGIILTICFIGITGRYHQITYPPCESEFDTAALYFLVLNSTIGFIYLCLVAGKMWKYPNDAFGIKNEFKLYGITPIILFVMYFVLRGFIVNMKDYLPLVLLIFLHILPIISIDIPIYQSWRLQRKLIRQGDSRMEELVQLKHFLKRPEGLRAFLEYLKSEFSSENLLFWCEVQNFKRLAITAKNDTTQAKIFAIQMYEKFLKPEAPCLLNLPHEISKATCRAIQKLGGFEITLPGKTEEEPLDLEDETNIYDIFNKAEEEIYRLMSSDSFYRFQKTTSYERVASIYKNLPPSNNSNPRSNSNHSHHQSIDQVINQSFHLKDKKMIDDELSVSASAHFTLLQGRTIPSSPSTLAPTEDEISSPSKFSHLRSGTTTELESLRLPESSFGTSSSNTTQTTTGSESPPMHARLINTNLGCESPSMPTRRKNSLTNMTTTPISEDGEPIDRI